MSIYRMIWWITAVILAASGGIAAAVTVQTDVLVSAVIAAVLIGGGSPWLRPITRRTTPPPRNLLAIALPRRRYVGGRSGHCHRIDHSRRRSRPTVDTADGHHLCSGMPLSSRQSRVHTVTAALAEESPHPPTPRRCAASSAARLQSTVERSPVPMLANELSRPEERSLDIALGHGRPAPRAYPRGLSRRNRTSRSKGIRPMVRQRRPRRQ